MTVEFKKVARTIDLSEHEYDTLLLANAYIDSVGSVSSLMMIDAAKAHAQAKIDFWDAAKLIAGVVDGETMKISCGSKKIIVYEEQE